MDRQGTPGSARRHRPDGPSGCGEAARSRLPGAGIEESSVRALAKLEQLVADRASPTAGRLEVVDEQSCLLHAGSNSLDALAIYVGLKGVDFEVLEPPELIDQLRLLADRLQRAAA